MKRSTITPSSAINPQHAIPYDEHLADIHAAITAMQEQLKREPDDDAEQWLAGYLLGQAMHMVGEKRGITHPTECARFMVNLLMVQVRKEIPYEEYLTTKHWRTTRLAALDRAEHRCQLCGGTDRLEVHHRDYSRLWNERDSDLTVLCRSCHSRFHGVER